MLEGEFRGMLVLLSVSRVSFVAISPPLSATLLMRHTDSGIVKDDQCVDVVNPFDPESSLIMLP